MKSFLHNFSCFGIFLADQMFSGTAILGSQITAEQTFLVSDHISLLPNSCIFLNFLVIRNNYFWSHGTGNINEYNLCTISTRFNFIGDM